MFSAVEKLYPAIPEPVSVALAVKVALAVQLVGFPVTVGAVGLVLSIFPTATVVGAEILPAASFAYT